MVVSAIGYIKFTDSLTEEYNDSAFRTAESAVMLVNGDKIDEYIETEKNRSGTEDDPFVGDEYADRWQRMNILCQKQNVTLIYVTTTQFLINCVVATKLRHSRSGCCVNI